MYCPGSTKAVKQTLFQSFIKISYFPQEDFTGLSGPHVNILLSHNTCSRKSFIIQAADNYSIISKSKTYCLIFLAPSYEDLVGCFQLGLYRHYNNGGEPIYDADEMEKFANIHAPTLFTQLVNSITNKNGAQSKERHELQRRRTVALLHILSYFR